MVRSPDWSQHLLVRLQSALRRTPFYPSIVPSAERAIFRVVRQTLRYGNLSMARRTSRISTLLTGRGCPPVQGSCSRTGTRPMPDDVIGLFQQSARTDVDRAIEAAARAYQQWRLVPAPQARRDPVSGGPAHRRPEGSARARHDARDGQGPGRDARRRAGGHRHDVLHGGRRTPPVRADGALRAARQVRDVGAPAARRVRADHAVEFSDGDPVVEDHPGARLRQHGGLQAGHAHAACRPSTSSRFWRRPECLLAWSIW